MPMYSSGDRHLIWAEAKIKAKSGLRNGNYLSGRMRKGPFSSSPGPLFQNEIKCSASDIEMLSYSHGNKTHFHKKG